MFLIEVRYAVSAEYTPDFEQWYKKKKMLTISLILFSIPYEFKL